MDIKNPEIGNQQNQTKTINTAGYISSVLLALVTAVTFIIAILTPPITGPFSAGATVVYPYTDIISRFPRDYYWMYPAMLLMLIYVVYMVCINQSANPNRKLFSQIALLLASLAAGIIYVDYFVQISVVQPSLINGEVEAIPLLTQYNPHGLFIALEEAGYLLMSIANLFLVPVFSGAGKIRAALRWTTSLNFLFVIMSLIIITIIYGISREYLFEIAVITFNFITLITLGLLSTRLFWGQT